MINLELNVFIVFLFFDLASIYAFSKRIIETYTMLSIQGVENERVNIKQIY